MTQTDFVRYVGSSNNSYNLEMGRVYRFSHTYGKNITIQPFPNKFISLPPNLVEQINIQTLSLQDIFGADNSSITLNSQLVYDNEVVGLRFNSRVISIFDIEMEKLQGLSPFILSNLGTEELKPFGDLLLTEYEHTHRISALDLSAYPVICNQLVQHFNR